MALTNEAMAPMSQRDISAALGAQLFPAEQQAQPPAAVPQPAKEEAGNVAVEEAPPASQEAQAPVEEPAVEAEVQEEAPSQEAQPPKGGRAEKRIKEVLGKAKVAEHERDTARQEADMLRHEMLQLRQEMNQVRQAQDKPKDQPKTWDDLPKQQLESIMSNPDQYALTASQIASANLALTRKYAHEEASKLLEARFAQTQQREQEVRARSILESDYPEHQDKNSELYRLAERIYQQGLPERGINPGEFGAGLMGTVKAFDYASQLLTKQAQKPVEAKVKTLETKLAKANAKSQLEAGGRPNVTPPKPTRQEQLSQYEKGDRRERSVLMQQMIDSRLGAQIDAALQE